MPYYIGHAAVQIKSRKKGDFMTVDALSLLRAQAANHILADNRLTAACLALDETAYMAPRRCFFGSIHGTLDHLVTTDARYWDRLTGTPHPPTDANPIEYATRDAVIAAQLAGHARLKAIMADLTPDALDREVLLHETERWGRQADPVWIVLTHVFAHAVHHRGQIHDLLAQTEVKPPQIDEFFLRMDRADRAGEVAAAGVAAWMIDGKG
jgi:uncharacterized damage-inducible protein DinB